MSMDPEVLRRVLAASLEQWRCHFHDDHDPLTLEPRGQQCWNDPTHVLEFTALPPYSGRRWSFGCDEHCGPPAVEPEGWTYVAYTLQPWAVEDTDRMYDRAMLLHSLTIRNEGDPLWGDIPQREKDRYALAAWVIYGRTTVS